MYEQTWGGTGSSSPFFFSAVQGRGDTRVELSGIFVSYGPAPTLLTYYSLGVVHADKRTVSVTVVHLLFVEVPVFRSRCAHVANSCQAAPLAWVNHNRLQPDIVPPCPNACFKILLRQLTEPKLRLACSCDWLATVPHLHWNGAGQQDWPC